MSQSAKINDLAPKLNLSKIPLNEVREHKLNKDCQWVKELLIELNENARTKDPEDYIANTHLNMNFKLQKKFESNMGEYLLLDIHIEALFVTECVKSLEEMQDSIEIKAKCCFVEGRFADAEEYADQTDIYLSGDMYEMYFYDNRTIDLKEMLHEQIYLSVNQYPTVDMDFDPEEGSKKETLH